MKRDWELVRAVLIAAEELPPDGTSIDLGIVGYDTRVVYHHVALLIQAKLLQGGFNLNFGHDDYGYEVTGLTWEGHDFIESARNETLWRKAISKSADAGTGLSFGVLGDLLSAMARAALGL